MRLFLERLETHAHSFPTPTALCPLAQGCRAAATLGNGIHEFFYANGVVSPSPGLPRSGYPGKRYPRILLRQRRCVPFLEPSGTKKLSQKVFFTAEDAEDES